MVGVKMFLMVVALVTNSWQSASTTSPRWCAQSNDAYAKCQQISSKYPGQITCILGKGENDCCRKIAQGAADLSSFSGRAVYQAGKNYGLQVIMSERHQHLTASGKKYFAVAVAKKSSNLTYGTLKGAKSCHTGVQKSSGWILPVGNLLSSNMMTCVHSNQYASVAAFFTASCAPGAANRKYNKQLYGVNTLCSLCTGSGAAKCARDKREPYYGYEGAFACLKDGEGDVAFLKESMLTSLRPVDQAKYKLLCKDNTVADPKDYLNCNLAGAPANAVLTRSDASENAIWGYQILLERAATKFYHPHFSPKIHIFDGKFFSVSAIGLDRVPKSKRSYISYLGESYVKAVSALDACN